MNRTLFVDILLLLNLVFVSILVVILPWLNPPEQDQDQEVLSPGNVIVVMTWRPGPVDVDLWVWSKGENRPVGYSHMSGNIWNLLRDDLGTNDEIPTNFETAYSRGSRAGEYVINAHCYRCPQGWVDVWLEVSVRSGDPLDGNPTVTPLFRTQAQLNTGEEITLVRFELDQYQKVVEGSVNSDLKKLRSAVTP